MIYRLLDKLLISCMMTAIFTAAMAGPDDTEREGGLTGTGIIGEITALGSIIVNGQRISLAPDLPVSSVVGPKRADTLVPGDVVAVAVRPGNEDWTAETITEIHPLVGPVSALGEGQFSVLGVNILWPGAAPSIGQWVAVSGFWARQDVIATRVQLIAPRSTVSIQGSYHLSSEGIVPSVGALALSIDPLQHAREGDVIRVTGTLNGTQIEVTDVYLGLFDRPVSLILAEGYLTDIAPSGHYAVAGTGLSAYTDNHQSKMSLDRVAVCGLDGRISLPQDLPNPSLMARLGCPNPAN